jgi:fructokinase
MSGPTVQSALVIGEALVDVIAREGEPTEVFPGGSPLNVAVGLGRLGMPVALHSSFGTDAHGALIAAHLTANGVRVMPGTVSAASTSVARASIGSDGSAAYVFDVGWDPQPVRVAPEGLAVVHTGSIGAVLEPGASLVAAQLDALRGTATITYDPNIRPQLMGDPELTRGRILRMIVRADVVKASDEDIAWLYPHSDPARTAQSWLALGPSIVVVTRGADGAHVATRAGSVDIPAEKAIVADTVGAGDSFMSGLLVALAAHRLLGRDRELFLRSIDLETTRRVVEFAARCAAVTVSRRGANPPTRDEVAKSDS